MSCVLAVRNGTSAVSAEGPCDSAQRNDSHLSATPGSGGDVARLVCTQHKEGEPHSGHDDDGSSSYTYSDDATQRGGSATSSTIRSGTYGGSNSSGGGSSGGGSGAVLSSERLSTAAQRLRDEQLASDATRPDFRSPAEMYRRLCADGGVKMNRLVEQQFAATCVVCARRRGGIRPFYVSSADGDCDAPHHADAAGSQTAPLSNSSSSSAQRSDGGGGGYVFDLASNYVGLRGLAPILRVLRRFDYVQRLVLDNTLLDSAGVLVVCDVLERPSVTRCLRSLSLNDNPGIGAVGGRALETFAAEHAQVEEIGLRGTGVPPALLRSIGETLLWHKVSRMLALQQLPAPRVLPVAEQPPIALAGGGPPIKIHPSAERMAVGGSGGGTHADQAVRRRNPLHTAQDASSTTGGSRTAAATHEEARCASGTTAAAALPLPAMVACRELQLVFEVAGGGCPHDPATAFYGRHAAPLRGVMLLHDAMLYRV